MQTSHIPVAAAESARPDGLRVENNVPARPGTPSKMRSGTIRLSTARETPRVLDPPCGGPVPASGGVATNSSCVGVCHVLCWVFVSSLWNLFPKSSPKPLQFRLEFSSNHKLSANNLQRIFKASSKTLQEYFKRKKQTLPIQLGDPLTEHTVPAMPDSFQNQRQGTLGHETLPLGDLTFPVRH